MVGKDPAPFGAGTSEPHVTLDTSHHAGGLRPIESMAAARLVKTTDMIADIFTKATEWDTFVRMRRELRNEPAGEPPALIGSDRTKTMLARIIQRLS